MPWLCRVLWVEWFHLSDLGQPELDAERKRSALVQAARVGWRRLLLLLLLLLCVLEVRRFTKYGLPALPGRCATRPCVSGRCDRLAGQGCVADLARAGGCGALRS